jgi:hypothetical protein
VYDFSCIRVIALKTRAKAAQSSEKERSKTNLGGPFVLFLSTKPVSKSVSYSGIKL